MLWDWNSIDSN